MGEKDIQTNFELAEEFNGYVVQYPDVVKGIGSNPCIVMTTPKNPQLTKKNIELGRKIMKEEHRRCYKAVRVKSAWKVEPLVL